jgi:hypothetical protein
MQDNVDWRQIFRVECEKKKGLSSADLELVLGEPGPILGKPYGLESL